MLRNTGKHLGQHQPTAFLVAPEAMGFDEAWPVVFRIRDLGQFPPIWAGPWLWKSRLALRKMRLPHRLDTDSGCHSPNVMAQSGVRPLNSPRKFKRKIVKSR